MLTLQRLIRHREKVLKSAAAQRSAELMADFEQQLASEYSYDQDETWKRAVEEANHALEEAQATIAARCEELGIPAKFVASLNFVMQALGIGILAAATEAWMLYLGCLLVGAGVGNATSLPGLIIQQEFPKQHFARIVSLVVAINQFSFAFGPTLIAQLQHAEGTYTGPLLFGLAIEIAAAIIVLSPVVIRQRAAV